MTKWELWETLEHYACGRCSGCDEYKECAYIRYGKDEVQCVCKECFVGVKKDD